MAENGKMIMAGKRVSRRSIRPQMRIVAVLGLAEEEAEATVLSTVSCADAGDGERVILLRLVTVLVDGEREPRSICVERVVRVVEGNELLGAVA